MNRLCHWLSARTGNDDVNEIKMLLVGSAVALSGTAILAIFDLRSLMLFFLVVAVTALTMNWISDDQ